MCESRKQQSPTMHLDNKVNHILIQYLKGFMSTLHSWCLVCFCSHGQSKYVTELLSCDFFHRFPQTEEQKFQTRTLQMGQKTAESQDQLLSFRPEEEGRPPIFLFPFAWTVMFAREHLRDSQDAYEGKETTATMNVVKPNRAPKTCSVLNH